MIVSPTGSIVRPADPRDRWGTLSQAERDAAYDNTNAVSNSAELIDARNAASARIRARYPSALDVPYAKSERTRFDLYPAEVSEAPCLMFIHGGYWQRNSRELFATIVEGFAERGWSVAIPGYTLAPGATLTGIVGEVRQALDWLDAEGHAHGIRGPVLLSGWSAGAHLAAMALDHPRVTAGLAVSGVYDLAPIRDTYLNAALKLTDEEVATLSPLRLPTVRKPMAIAFGDGELPALVNDSIRLHAKRLGDGAPGSLFPVRGADHFTVLDDLSRADGRLVQVACNLIEEHAK